MEGIKKGDSVICGSYDVCKSTFSKAIGLMFSGRRNLIFNFDEERRISLHMMFVFFPIWAVYLNDEKEVVNIKKLLPFISMCYPKEKAKYILELVEKPEIKVGDKLSFE